MQPIYIPVFVEIKTNVNYSTHKLLFTYFMTVMDVVNQIPISIGQTVLYIYKEVLFLFLISFCLYGLHLELKYKNTSHFFCDFKSSTN